MEDLIASFSVSHMSQENLDLEMVKEHLARTLVVPASPSAASSDGSSLPRTRPPSLSLSSLQGFTFDTSSQPLPSPTANYPQFSFAATQPPSYSSSLTYPAYEGYNGYEDEASLSAAFAGDAFAPMWEKQAAAAAAPADQWRAFHEKSQAQYGIVNVEPQQEYVNDNDESMDEDAAEDLLIDEEEAVNSGYTSTW